jgi:glycosyltransferase involved in cell wall biosynthesis
MSRATRRGRSEPDRGLAGQPDQQGTGASAVVSPAVFKGHRIAVVVPAHNEEALVGTVITTMPDFVDHIVVIDDKSSDNTRGAALAVGDARAEVITHEVNQGVGGAIITGHRRAIELGADISVVMAGDAQMDPDHLPALLEPITDHGYGFSKANRFYSSDSFRGMPKYRVFGNVVLSFLTKLASGYWHIFDPQNGYTAVRTDVLRRLNLDRISRTYEFENDLLINMNILDVRATDVPIPALYGEEVSGIKLRRVIPAIGYLLVKGFWRRIMQKYVLRSFSPIALFLFAGLTMIGWSVLFGIWVLINTIGEKTASAGTVILCVAPFLVGTQLLINALTLDIQNSPD